MARTRLIIQKPQRSLLGSGSLPERSPRVSVPNIAAAFNSLTNAIMQRDEQQQNMDARLEGLRDGAAADDLGIDELGQPRRLPSFPGRNPNYQAAWHEAYLDKTVSGVQADLGNHLNEIQTREGLSLERRQELWQAAINGAKKSIPPAFHGKFDQWGNSQIEGRSKTVALQEHRQTTINLINSTKEAIGDRTEEAISMAASGLDAAPAIAEIENKVEHLVSIGAINEESAARTVANIRTFITATSFQRRMITSMIQGETTPDDLREFAVALKTGTEREIVFRKMIDPSIDDPTMIQETRISADEWRTAFKDDQIINQIAADMITASNLQNEFINKSQRGKDFVQWMGTAGPGQVLPSHLRDDWAKISDTMLATGAMDTPNGQQQLLGLLSVTKIMPAPLKDYLVAGLSESNPEQLIKIASFVEKVEHLRDRHGGMVGGMLLESIGEKEWRRLTEMSSIVRILGQDRISEYPAMRERARGIGQDQTEAVYREATTLSLPAAITEHWQERGGAGLAPGPYQTEVRRLYHVLLASGVENAPEAAFDHAVRRIDKYYQISSISSKGYTKSPSGISDVELQDLVESRTSYPDMTAETQGEGLGPAGADNDFTWMTGYLHKTLNAMIRERDIDLSDEVMADAVRSGLDQTNLIGDENSPFRLEEIGDDPANQSYLLQVMINGRPVQVYDTEGNPVLLNPQTQIGAERTALERRRQSELADQLQESKRKQKFYDAIQGGHGQWNRDPFASETGPFPGMGLPDYPEIQQKIEEYYREPPEDLKDLRSKAIDPNSLESGINAQMAKLDERVEELNNSNAHAYKNTEYSAISSENLMTPGAKGFDVTAMAVKQIDAVVPDGTGGLFMMRTAAAESSFGTAKNTFRSRGDRGIFQINDGNSAAFAEVKRLIQINSHPVANAANQLKEKLGIDLHAATKQDLDKPLISAAVARLYYLAQPGSIPKDVVGQAAYWKRHYNTRLGAGTVEHFIRASGSSKLNTDTELPPAATSYWSEGGGKSIALEQLKKLASGDGSGWDRYSRAPKFEANGKQYEILARYTNSGEAKTRQASYMLRLEPSYAANLAGFLQEAEANGHNIRIQSAFRSFEHQDHLFSGAKAKHGKNARKWVAPPGHSRHNYGIATDLSYNGSRRPKRGSDPQGYKAMIWAHQNAAKWGLNFRMGWEPWHIEAI